MNNKENRGVLFPNNKTKDTQPDYKGSAKVGSIDFFMSMWKCTSNSGMEYFKVSFTEATKKAEDKEEPRKEQLDITKGMVKPDLSNQNDEYLNDDIPF